MSRCARRRARKNFFTSSPSGRPIGGGDVDGPMAGATDVGRAAVFERLEGADPVALVVNPALGRLDHLLEDVLEAFVAEIAFFLRDPFLKSEMRLDDELGHGCRPRRGG